MQRLHKRLNIFINFLSTIIVFSILFMMFGGMSKNYSIFSISSHFLIIAILIDVFCIIKLSNVIKKESRLREEIFVQSLKDEYGI